MAKLSNELITIGIPVYNMENSILDAVKSAINQTYQNTEILIVDDGSTDNSIQIIKDNITDPRVRIYQRERNGGIAKAMNTIVKNANGKYLIIFDADDISVPIRIEKQLEVIKELEVQYPNNFVISVCGYDMLYIEEQKLITKFMNEYCFFGGFGVSMCRIDDIKKMNYFDEKFFRHSDTIFHLDFLLANGKYTFIQQSLVCCKYIATADKMQQYNIETPNLIKRIQMAKKIYHQFKDPITKKLLKNLFYAYKQFTFLEKLFSVYIVKKHKIIRFLFLKISIRLKD